MEEKQSKGKYTCYVCGKKSDYMSETRYNAPNGMERVVYNCLANPSEDKKACIGRLPEYESVKKSGDIHRLWKEQGGFEYLARIKE